MPHQTTDESYMPNINKSGKNYRKSDHPLINPSLIFPFVVRIKVDFTTTKKQNETGSVADPVRILHLETKILIFGLRINHSTFAFTLGICDAQIERIPLPINQFQPSTRRTIKIESD